MTSPTAHPVKRNLIILAGGEKGPLSEPTGYDEKALIPIHGVPMLSRVIRAFNESRHVDNIVVVGSRNLDDLPEMKHVRKRVFEGIGVVQNLLHAVTYVKHRLYHSHLKHNGYLISFCDAVFLTPEIIDHTLAEIDRHEADVVLTYIDKTAFEEQGLPANRTYLPVGGLNLTGSTIYFLRSWTRVLRAMPTLVKLRQHRKNPSKIFELVGCTSEMSLDEISTALSKKFGLTIKIAISPHARLGMDVDKPSDLELAKRLLQ